MRAYAMAAAGLWTLMLHLPAAQALSLWEAGRLDYPDGTSEVAAFVNGPQQTQLQAVLCAKTEEHKNRLSLLLPQFYPDAMIFEIELNCGGEITSAYAELAGNTLEFQLDDEFYLALAQSPSLTLTFKPEDAAYLNLPVSLDLPLLGAGETLKSVAHACTLLCLDQDFKCRQGLLSALLWPEQGFNRDHLGNVDELCTAKTPRGWRFNLTQSCRLALDRFYLREGQGPLSFLYQLFHAPDGAYQKYQTLWNDAVRAMPTGPAADLGLADGSEWYLGLYALAGTRQLREYPLSYFSILNSRDDPTTLLYDIDGRYEMEGLKYLSVLMRRLPPSYQLHRSVEQALNAWADFYRQLTYLQPFILKAQALRPVMYRQMLLRIWNLAGRPQGLNLRPEHAFRQGTGSRTVTDSPLENKCAYFEGMRGDEFFFGSNDCLHSIRTELSTRGLKSEQYGALLAAWDEFADAWSSSIFYAPDGQSAAGETQRAAFGLTMLTACEVFGFGDYFLMRQCISSRDADICTLEKERQHNTLEHELLNRVNAIAAVSQQDAQALRDLQQRWETYSTALTSYIDDLVQRGRLPYWQGQLVQGVAAVLQTNAVLSAPYYREELPDETLLSEDDFAEPAPQVKSEVQDLERQALDEAQRRQAERAQQGSEQEEQP